MEQLTKNQQLETLQKLVGKKITIFTESDFGFPVKIHCVLERVYLKNYAQYNNLLHIEYRPFKKRTSYVKRVYDYSTFIIWENYLNVNAEMFVSSETDAQGTKISKSLTGFSKGYALNALQSVKQAPFFQQIK